MKTQHTPFLDSGWIVLGYEHQRANYTMDLQRTDRPIPVVWTVAVVDAEKAQPIEYALAECQPSIIERYDDKAQTWVEQHISTPVVWTVAVLVIISCALDWVSKARERMRSWRKRN